MIFAYYIKVENEWKLATAKEFDEFEGEKEMLLYPINYLKAGDCNG